MIHFQIDAALRILSFSGLTRSLHPRSRSATETTSHEKKSGEAGAGFLEASSRRQASLERIEIKPKNQT